MEASSKRNETQVVENSDAILIEENAVEPEPVKDLRNFNLPDDIDLVNVDEPGQNDKVVFDEDGQENAVEVDKAGQEEFIYKHIYSQIYFNLPISFLYVLHLVLLDDRYIDITLILGEGRRN